ncbi:hypothetical protein CAPTEDRAFT_111368 [Capitella teleta]|uniref:Solute carrier family 23 member 2 n=1 Tax=Capitella teleta TaxID=283909 RepID=R7UCI7_CAPTE|nr:hypothetical protein CAPTEDRAFT_111368 [Capitella teleta]|eukprot:ELU01493.1 hypothetical protein CAPTEDRAFT_111368 [Capitella teleta]
MAKNNLRHRNLNAPVFDEGLEDGPLDESTGFDLRYRINDVPPWYLSIVLGLQHYLTMFGSTLSLPLLVAPAMCVGNDIIVTSEILGTLLFVSGLITLMQSTLVNIFACCYFRLPVIQGGSFAFLAPTFAILNLDKFQCPGYERESINDTNKTLEMYTGSTEHTEVWQVRMREIQGAIIASSMFQVVIGFSGMIGVLLRYIGPLSIAPTISLIGLSLFKEAANNASQNWWISLMTVALIVLFSQYLRNTSIPCCSVKGKRCGCTPYRVFQMFPIILALLIAWGVCAILTVTNALPDDDQHWAYAARTDIKLNALSKAAWFRFPYPGQWGTPTFSVASVFGMLAGVLAGTIESIGDYYAAARMSGAPIPPLHAINRGVFMEGIGCTLAGVWGTGSGTTTYSQNIGAIGITKVGSRRVIQVAAIIIMIFGLIGKLGALFVSIPGPILGGIFMVMFGMITAVGISNLQFVDLDSSRNLFIFGFSLFFGLCLPQWVKTKGNFIHSGSDVFDQILVVLLTTGMLVGGLTGFVLDNTIPGTKKERGLVEWSRQDVGNNKGIETYDIPIVTKHLKKWSWTSYFPISPTYSGCKCSSARGDLEITTVVG